MRFHIGLSMNLKKALKYILPFIAVGFVSYFINTGVVLADDEPVISQTPYYEITNDENNCNVFIGDTTTSIIQSVSQVSLDINYSVPQLKLTQTSRLRKGYENNHAMFVYKKPQDNRQLYFSYEVDMNDSSTCDDVSNPCAPKVYIKHCTTSDLSNCPYTQSIVLVSGNNQAEYPLVKKNQVIWRLTENFATTPTPYFAIFLSNVPSFADGESNYGAITLPIGQGFTYKYYTISDSQVNDLPEYSKTFCTNTGDHGGGNVSDSTLIEQVNNQITSISSLIDLYSDDDSIGGINLSNYVGNFFGDIVAPSSPLASILVFPLAMVETIIDNNNTCTPYSIDLSSITRRFGGSDYILTLPCIRSKLQTLLGNWYETFDLLIAGILFYYFAVNLVMKINYALNGEDFMPYFFGRVVDDDIYQTKKKRAMSR